MSCETRIDLKSIVEAIIDGYGDQFADEIIKRLNLSQYVKVNKGEAIDLTLRGSLTVDEAVKGDLCSILTDCINTKISDKLKVVTDNFVQEFSIDNTHDLLVIRMKGGEEYSVSKEELQKWLGVGTSTGGTVVGGGIKSGTLVITETVPPTDTTEEVKGSQVIKVVNKDDTTVDIDVTALQGSHVQTGTLTDKNTITLTQKVGGNVVIDITALHNGEITSGSLVDGKTLRLVKIDGSTVDVDISGLVVPHIVSGTIVGRDGGYWLDLVNNDNTKVSVDFTDFVNKLTQSITEKLLGIGYIINTQNNHYTLQESDFTGHTLVRGNRDGDQTITITKPSDSFIGKSVVVRKTNGGVGTSLTIKTDTGVTISPADISPLRRIGSTVTLVYIGDGNWDAFGELA